jgi:hypothetical protein
MTSVQAPSLLPPGGAAAIPANFTAEQVKEIVQVSSQQPRLTFWRIPFDHRPDGS